MEKKPTTIEQHGRSLECQIQSLKAILNSLLKTHGSSLSDESFQTLLFEVEATINSHPLTTDVLNDVTSLAPLSPVGLIMLKSKVAISPPGHFTSPDLYCRKYWRRV